MRMWIREDLDSMIPLVSHHQMAGVRLETQAGWLIEFTIFNAIPTKGFDVVDGVSIEPL